LAARCMEIVRTKDTGTLQYDIYFNDDQSECIVHERYTEWIASAGTVKASPALTVLVAGVKVLTERRRGDLDAVLDDLAPKSVVARTMSSTFAGLGSGGRGRRSR
jgi:hypothetical protein